jgi:riboflavin kinase / FMN adenylyltransferase
VLKILSWDTFRGGRPLQEIPTSLSIGVFDGVHRGHRRLLERVTEAGELSTVVTFRYNPRRFLKPHLFPGDITTLEQKLAILDAEGVATVILIDFSNDFSTLTGREFLLIIRRSCKLTRLVLGDNFRCGHRGDTSAYDARDILAEEGIPVYIETPVSWKGATLSSTRIRAALREGEIEEAKRMMDRVFSLDIASSPVEREGKRRRIEKDGLEQVLPPSGSYLVTMKGPDNDVRGKIEIDNEEIVWTQTRQGEIKTIDVLRKIEEGA